MPEDEEMSPTLEEVIIVWCLEKIHPNLPKFVNQRFSEKINDDYSLFDIQEDIFEIIPSLLKENPYDIAKVGDSLDAKVKEEQDEGCDIESDSCKNQVK